LCSKHCKDDYRKQEQQEIRKRLFLPLAPRGTQYPQFPLSLMAAKKVTAARETLASCSPAGQQTNVKTLLAQGLSVSRIPPCVCATRDCMRKR
jgi:hypothetical protein